MSIRCNQLNADGTSRCRNYLGNGVADCGDHPTPLHTEAPFIVTATRKGRPPTATPSNHAPLLDARQRQAAALLFSVEPETREDCRTFRHQMRAAAQRWSHTHVRTSAGLVVLSAPAAEHPDQEPRPGDRYDNRVLLRALLTVGETTPRTYLVSGSANTAANLVEPHSRWVPETAITSAATPGGAAPRGEDWKLLGAAMRQAATGPQGLPWLAYSLASALLVEAGYPQARGGTPRLRPWEPPTPFRRQAGENLRLCLGVLAAAVQPDPDVRRVALTLAHDWTGSAADLITCVRGVLAR